MDILTSLSLPLIVALIGALVCLGSVVAILDGSSLGIVGAAVGTCLVFVGLNAHHDAGDSAMKEELEDRYAITIEDSDRLEDGERILITDGDAQREVYVQVDDDGRVELSTPGPGGHLTELDQAQ